MKRIIFVLVFLLGPVLSPCVLAQDPTENKAQGATKQVEPPADAAPPSAKPASKRLTIEVTGGANNVAVEDASVYLKYAEERKLRKDRKYSLNVKTNHEGRAHIPDPPVGRVLIQIVADGWKSFGQYYELSDPGTVIKIHLERPPKWY
jgi:hypothetical protein